MFLEEERCGPVSKVNDCKKIRIPRFHVHKNDLEEKVKCNAVDPHDEIYLLFSVIKIAAVMAFKNEIQCNLCE